MHLTTCSVSTLILNLCTVMYIDFFNSNSIQREHRKPHSQTPHKGTCPKRHDDRNVCTLGAVQSCRIWLPKFHVVDPTRVLALVLHKWQQRRKLSATRLVAPAAVLWLAAWPPLWFEIGCFKKNHYQSTAYFHI